MRFHSLPGSKRYPTSDDEYATVLHRHNTVLEELTDDPNLLLITCDWGEIEQPEPRDERLRALDPAGTLWQALPPDDYRESWTYLYISERSWMRGVLDPVLRAVADDILAGVMVAPGNLSWIYHPYDGGADVLLPTSGARDHIRERHRDWLSAHPSGL
ncbi:hypothetical protein HDA40_001825 [Hamadaea flava]|uniref:DUF3885 domain-containing protein n=1 Tax=Hamadaea flava TaxID=1742688 RepID=A0ABV8LNP7_9ACTN|nr:hypothetical protein [Hamadaea flava]MCP2323318.1 hypothetical protein [Hamadaea flava]